MKIKSRFFVILFIILSSTVLAQEKVLNLSDIWLSRNFFPNYIDEIRSMNDGEHYTVLKNNSIIQYKYKTGKEDITIINGKDIKYDGNTLIIDDYTFSYDESLILLTTETEPIYRHSFTANYFIYNTKTKQLQPLSVNGKQMLAEFSPDGRKVAFIRDNNLFLTDALQTGKEMKITKDGEINKIIYGAPDWVYEEEFSFSKGFQWSQDSKRIAYYRFDESKVPEFTIELFKGETYPEKYPYKYPKAGERNSIVNVFVYELESNKSQQIDTGAETDLYIPRIQWTNNPEVLSVQRLNRLQNFFEIIHYNIPSGKQQVVYSEKNNTYIDITDNLNYFQNGSFILTSEKDGYNHIYLFNTEGKELLQLTKGNFDVFSIISVDEKEGKIYYSSSEDGAMNKMIYSVTTDGKTKVRLFDRPGFYDVDFSKSHEYFILTFSAANVPPQYSIYNNKLKQVVVLEENNELIAKMKEYAFIEKQFISIPIKDNITLNAWIMKPAQLKPEKKYPVLFYVYGGPGIQTVTNSWGSMDYIWAQMLVQKGIIVVSVDNRGTGGRGEAFKKCTYLQLGKLESEDQIEAAKYFSNQQYVDKQKIGIFGWSYGGFMSSLCITKGADVFSTAIAVAPVTNWKYYDNIYTERYMRKPAENIDGYEKNSPVFYAKKLKGNFLLIHGGADDNVHVQNSMELVNALISANKPFDWFVYPNKNHGIYGGNTRYHLYNKMTNFLINSFLLEK